MKRSFYYFPVDGTESRVLKLGEIPKLTSMAVISIAVMLRGGICFTLSNSNFRSPLAPLPWIPTGDQSHRDIAILILVLGFGDNVP